MPRSLKSSRHCSVRKARSLLLEPLEERTVPTIFVVDSLSDVIDGSDATADGSLTLREAITAANSNSAYGDAPAGSGTATDAISFSPSLAGGTIALAGAELTISESVSITGLGADQLTISGGSVSRVFMIDDGLIASIQTVLLSDLTIMGGRSLSADLTLNAGRGGGIHSFENLTVSRSLVAGNTTNADGAGIWIRYGDLLVTESTISGNTASFKGGALYSRDNDSTILNSTLSGNVVNVGASSGGAIYARSGFHSASHSTISGNSSNSAGGGIVGVDLLFHSIVADNVSNSATGNNINGVITANWSLIGDTSSTTLSGSNNLVDVAPVLGSLSDNGGPTPT